MDSEPFSKGNQGFLRHYLIPPHRWREREVEKWENKFRAAQLREEASADVLWWHGGLRCVVQCLWIQLSPQKTKSDPTPINAEKKKLRLKACKNPVMNWKTLSDMSESLKIKSEWPRGTGWPSHVSVGDLETTPATGLRKLFVLLPMFLCTGKFTLEGKQYWLE